MVRAPGKSRLEPEVVPAASKGSVLGQEERALLFIERAQGLHHPHPSMWAGCKSVCAAQSMSGFQQFQMWSRAGPKLIAFSPEFSPCCKSALNLSRELAERLPHWLRLQQ